MMNLNQAVADKSEIIVKHHVLLTVNRKTVAGTSPYRLTDARGNDIKQVNDYLDSLAVRGLSERTIRIYAYNLLDFWRWLTQAKIVLTLKDITRASMFQYIQYQRQEKSPSAITINHRLAIVQCLYQFHFERRIPAGIHSIKEAPADFGRHNFYRRIGWMHPFRAKQSSVTVKAPRRVIVPLTYSEVFNFFNSLKSWRDITIAGFMLFCGLRSREVITIQLDDVGITEGQVLIHGKSEKERILPLPKDLILVLDKYINLERPKTNSQHLFVILKGPRRGEPLTYWVIRDLFRYHRKISGISNANPHRFRHTFGADMTRAGISLPALMKLMGHSSVQMTMRYVNLFAKDVKDEFNKATANLRTREIINGTKSEP